MSVKCSYSAEFKTEKTYLRHCLLTLAAFALAALTFAAEPGAALEDGRIGVLYIGCIARSRPFWLMRSDPLFRMGFVQATLRDWAAVGPLPALGEAQVHRMVRMQMPRTYADLVANYDVIALHNGNVLAVAPHIQKLAQGVSEGGLGLLMSGGWESFGGTGSSYPPWGETAVGKLLPTNDVIGIWVSSGRLGIEKPRHELMSSLPWDLRDPDLANEVKWDHNLVTLKAGAEQLAHATYLGREDPLMITWRLGNDARVFALTSEIHRFFWQGGAYRSVWRYAYDFGCNLVIYLDNRAVPQDVELVHVARAKMLEVETRRSLLVALLDFCESFGATTRGIMSRFEEIDQVIAEAMPQYLQLQFEDMLESYRVAEKMLAQAEEEGVRLKNRTLLWIYVIEWLAVTGTSMVCGFILWSLMIRRRLYREVQTTRFET